MRQIFVLGLALVLPALGACGDDGGGSTSDSGSTSSSTSTTNATPGTSTDASSGGSTEGTSDASASSTVSPTSDPTMGSTTNGGDEGVMGKFGHACASDADCVAVLGDGGVCLKDILMVYNLPGGYCSKICKLPDAMTAYVPDDPICGPGVTCIGAMGYFEGCAVECADNSDCPRQGYECRIMPTIGMPGDPTFCLMTEDNKI